MASGACSSFQVCDSVSGTGSFQNLSHTYTHVSGSTRNRKCKGWQVEVFALIVMFVAMRMWGKYITDAATMTATVFSHSAKVICHWAYMSIHEMSPITQDNITDDDIEHVF